MLEDTKVAIRCRNSKDRQCNGQKKKDIAMIYTTLHRKLKIEEHQHHYKLGNLDAPEG